MKYSIVVFTDGSEASALALPEILAGIEEEGVRFEYATNSTLDMETTAQDLAGLAARESAFGCGVGVSKGYAVLWLQSHGMGILFADKQDMMRRLGLNAGRALKKQPFIG